MTSPLDFLPPGWRDPDLYLNDLKFHRTLKWTATETVVPDGKEQRVSYAVVGSEEPDATTLVMINGLGGHRLISFMWDGFLSDGNVRFITIDRPSCGASTPCPLPLRVQWTSEALSLVLLHENITTFTLLSHSNGIIYSLYFLLHLPSPLSCSRWLLTSPYVPPWMSSKTLLSLARWIPTTATTNLGPLAKFGLTSLGPLTSAFSWSAGVSSALLQPKTNPLPSAPLDVQYAKAVAKGNKKPPERRNYSYRYVSTKCMDKGMEYILAEGLDYLGPEACMALKNGGAVWGWPGEEEGEEGLYERAFEEIAKVRQGLKCWVWAGDDDGLVPVKGQEALKGVLEKTGVLAEDGWVWLKAMGHDEVLGLECVMGKIAELTKRAD